MPSAIQREIRQRRPFASRAEEAVVALARTADLLRRALAAALAPHEITLQQYNVLRILRGAGEEGLPTLEIAVRMVEQAPGVTRLLDRLERKQLVRRVRCPRDRRQVLCWITPRGRALLSGLDARMAAAAQGFVAPLSRADLDRFIRLMDAVRAPRTAS